MLDHRNPTGDDDSNEANASPKLDLARVASNLRPPVRPFSAKPFFKGNPFIKASLAKGSIMSERFNSDRLAAFTPQIPRRVADIPNAASVRAEDAEGKRLVVGKSIRMKGEISGCERLIVEGHVDANLSEVKAIDVSANGSFHGKAEVDTAVIAGTYEGTLTVRGHLEIAPSGLVKGTVTYKTISVANGGRVLGTIESTDT